MKSLSFIIIFLSALLIPSFGSDVSAHILLTSDSGRSSMIVHIIPDDDPIAGESAEMFFDISGDIGDSNANLELNIVSEDSSEEAVELINSGGSNYKASYIFPNQGLYKLAITAGNERIAFSQRVSRGVSSNYSNKKNSYIWAEIGLIGSSCLILVILILIINRRGQILAFTYRSQNEQKNKKP